MKLNCILVPVDFSPHAQHLVDHACRLAVNAGAALHLVNVSGSAHDAVDSDEAKRIVLERLATLLPAATELELKTHKAALRGVPHHAIVQYAEAHCVDLIVMGTHGRKGWSHLALGSVAERVLRNAPCPVQVLRTPRHRPQKLHQAAEALARIFGQHLEGNHQSTKQQIIDTIGEQLRISYALAESLFDELSASEWVVWEHGSDGDGRWLFVQGIEFVEAASSFIPNKSDSAAVDLISRACKLRSTDLHLDPRDHSSYSVRLRIDGQLHEYCHLDRDVAEHLTNQLKMLANLDITEPFLAKEGRLQLPDSASELADLQARLTTAPVAGGEAVALRLFSRAGLLIPVSELGLDKRSSDAVDQMLQMAEGLVLVTGPTGSGKTTTVYSMLESIGTTSKNIVSIEDPVEFSIPFIRQMEVDLRHGLTMVDGLKTLLRMDPDIVFLGEVRDESAADIVMRAASAGRYVFSTLHTRDVASVVTTLRDMGLSDRTIASNLSGVINQRLVRKLCTNCRRDVEPTISACGLFEQHALPSPQRLFEPKGCDRCRHTGYYGRTGVFEAIAMHADLRQAISAGADEARIRRLLMEAGMASLDVQALEKVGAGITSVDEALRVRAL